MGDQIGSKPSKFTDKVLNGSLFVWGEGSVFSTDSRKGSQPPPTPRPSPLRKAKPLQKVKPFKGQFLGEMFLCWCKQRWSGPLVSERGPWLGGPLYSRSGYQETLRHNGGWFQFHLGRNPADTRVTGCGLWSAKAGLGPGWNNPSVSTQKISCWH